MSAQTDHHQDDDDDDDDQDDGDHPRQDLAVRVVLGAGTHVMVQVVVADVGVHAGVTQTLVDVLLTVFPLVSSGTVTAVVRVEVVGSVGVRTREDAGGITHSSIMTRGIHYSKLDSQGKRGAICIVFKIQVDTEVSKYIHWSCEIEGECGPG